jgi:hypothetical protein
VINPWSFVNWVRKRKFISYWVSTSNVETIATVLTPHIKRLMEEIFTILFDNQKFEISELVSQVNYASSNWKTTSILHFLVHTGYLTYEANRTADTGVVWIPNKEIRLHWEEHVIELLKSTLNPQFQETLLNAVLAVPFLWSKL